MSWCNGWEFRLDELPTECLGEPVENSGFMGLDRLPADCQSVTDDNLVLTWLGVLPADWLSGTDEHPCLVWLGGLPAGCLSAAATTQACRFAGLPRDTEILQIDGGETRARSLRWSKR